MPATIIQRLEMISTLDKSFETLEGVAEFMKNVPDVKTIDMYDIEKLHAIGSSLALLIPNMKACFSELGIDSISRS